MNTLELRFWLERWGKTIKYATIILSLWGVVTFSLFILEESFQTVMFSTWPSKDIGDWQTVKESAELMDGIIWTMETVNNSIGWIQPLAFISYRSYALSARQYTKSLRREALAREPQWFIGEDISVSAFRDQITTINGDRYYKRGRLHIRTDKVAADAKTYSGKLEIRNAILVID